MLCMCFCALVCVFKSRGGVQRTKRDKGDQV